MEKEDIERIAGRVVEKLLEPAACWQLLSPKSSGKWGYSMSATWPTTDNGSMLNTKRG